MHRTGPNSSTYFANDGGTLLATIVSRLPGKPWWGLPVAVAQQLITAGPHGFLILVSSNADSDQFKGGDELRVILANAQPRSGGRQYHLHVDDKGVLYAR